MLTKAALLLAVLTWGHGPGSAGGPLAQGGVERTAQLIPDQQHSRDREQSNRRDDRAGGYEYQPAAQRPCDDQKTGQRPNHGSLGLLSGARLWKNPVEIGAFDRYEGVGTDRGSGTDEAFPIIDFFE